MGAPIKFLHTADLHLKRDEPFRLNVLSWIVSKTEKLANGLIIAGDLFENDIEASFLRGKVREIFERINPLPILIIPGNHDSLAYSPETHYGDNVILFSEGPSKIKIKGIKIAGIPFHPQLDFSQCIEKLEFESKPDVAIAHGTLYDKKFPEIYTELEEEAKYMPIYSWHVEGKMKYLALGHYHSRFIQVGFGKTQVVYPGAPLATSRRSVGKRFVALVQIEKDGEVKVEKIPVEISSYWEKIEWMVFPGKEEKKLEEIDREIKRLACKKVMLEGKIKGSIKMGEREFRDRVKEIEEKYRSSFKCIHLLCEIKHWAHLLQNPTVALFMEKLRGKNYDDLLKERALELTLSALEKLRK